MSVEAEMAGGEPQLEFHEEGAVDLIPEHHRNRGQETMPWKHLETIVGASVFINGDPPGTGTLISHKGDMWLLTSNYVLPKHKAKDLNLHFGYIDKDHSGVAISGSDLLDTEKWFEHETEKGGYDYTFVAIREDFLKKKLLGKLPVPIYWVLQDAAEGLQKLDHLYTIHYPDPERKGENQRCFGGDIIQGTLGAYIFCAMSAWPGSQGAPLFKTDERLGQPQLVGIFIFSQPWKKREDDRDRSVSTVACNIIHIKKHIATNQWDKKDTPVNFKVPDIGAN